MDFQKMLKFLRENVHEKIEETSQKSLFRLECQTTEMPKILRVCKTAKVEVLLDSVEFVATGITYVLFFRVDYNYSFYWGQ